MDHTLIRAPETKVATGEATEVAESFEEFMEAFEAFKAANDERLQQVETRVSADVVTVEKMNRINKALDDQKARMDALVLKNSRPGLTAEHQEAGSDHEHKQAFNAYVRKGDETGLRQFEQKAMSIGSDPDGGFLVPDETATEIGRRMTLGSPIRSIAGIQPVSASVYKKPFAVTGPQAGWVSETAARPETTSPTLAELSFPTMELYAMPAATTSLLEDAAVDLDAWIASEVETVFAEQESAAFVNGDGVNKPLGFLKAPQIDELTWSWGNLGYVTTGVEGAFGTTDPADILLDAVYVLKAGYRQNANWVMNRKTQTELRKLKDADGNYLWSPPSGAGQPASLMGFNIVESEDMPDIEPSKTPIAFGDFNRGYLIVDRTGVRILRDPYSAKPYVLFYTTKRVGGGVQDYDAIKLIKFGTS